MPKPRETYSPEFMQEAVRLVKTAGKSCAEVARDLEFPLMTSFAGDSSTSSRPAAQHSLGAATPRSVFRKPT